MTTSVNIREGGLLRAVGAWGLAAGIVNVTIGGGIYRLPGSVAETIAPTTNASLSGRPV